MVIIETEIFTQLVTDLMDDDEYAQLQRFLARNPKAGDVIQGTGGLRKVRWKSHGKGKRGGTRIIYYHADALHQLRMLLIYEKGAIKDLTEDQKKTLKKLIDTWD
ncbi:type II toxin-antitoxin system RelE/ParE family toxin [Dyella subtropica]|uniref:type II toxin-antitoxin system RelE/ParE family toxin n=1 Tax=Dyella subtropica TaxID=2992127 RepID=UPI0022596FB5|nr:type II toxin-antitoxin system RelE/ParE family toxin [Dyella subtropica]